MRYDGACSAGPWLARYCHPPGILPLLLHQLLDGFRQALLLQQLLDSLLGTVAAAAAAALPPAAAAALPAAAIRCRRAPHHAAPPAPLWYHNRAGSLQAFFRRAIAGHTGLQHPHPQHRLICCAIPWRSAACTAVPAAPWLMLPSSRLQRLRLHERALLEFRLPNAKSLKSFAPARRSHNAAAV